MQLKNQISICNFIPKIIMKKLTIFFTVLVCFATTFNSLLASEDSQSNFFIENKNQWPSNILYKAKMDNARIFLENDKLTFMMISPDDLEDVHRKKHNPELFPNGVVIDYHAYYVRFVNANPSPSLEADAKLTAYHNYFIGNDESKWASSVGLYHKVTYRDLYPSIDYQLYFNGQAIKYDLIVKPGANMAPVKFLYEGLDNMYIDIHGDLVLMNSVNDVYEMKPYAYQMIDGLETPVLCNYVLNGEELSFEFPAGYDTTKELILDPGIVFSTYTGSVADNWGSTATYDLDGNAYGGGMAFQMNGGNIIAEYPTSPGAFQSTFQGGDPASNLGGTDIAIIKYTPDGTDMIYSTYLGGNGDEFPHSLIVNHAGNLVIYGTSGSTDFPTGNNAFDTTHNGGPFASLNGANYSNGVDIILVTLNEDGTALLAGTYLGGSGSDGLNGIAALAHNYGDQGRGEIVVDEDDNVYLTSSTNSDNFPTTNGVFQPDIEGGQQDGIVAKFNNALSQLIWSSYIGGTAGDGAYSLKLDANNDIYICGGTLSTNFPFTEGSYDGSLNGDVDGFIAKIANDGSEVLACTAVNSPGSFYDQTYMLDIDFDGYVYVVGQTLGAYPTAGTAFENPGSGQFVHKFQADLSDDVWSTVFGSGSGLNISPTAFLVDNCGRIYISGWGGLNSATSTLNMNLTSDAFQSTTDGRDFYFAVFEADMESQIYGSYFGSSFGTGDHVDGGTSRFDKQGVMYQAVCASCDGGDFPTTPGAWSEESGSTRCNMGLIKFAFESENVIAGFVQQPSACAPVTYTFENTSINATAYEWDFGNGITSSNENPTVTYNEAGNYIVSLIASNPESCNLADTISYTLQISQSELVSSFTAEQIGFCAPITYVFENTSTGGNNFNWNFGDGSSSELENPQHIYNEPGIYTVTLTVSSIGECEGTDSYDFEIEVPASPNATLAPINNVCGTAHLVPISIDNLENFSYTNDIGLMVNYLDGSSDDFQVGVEDFIDLNSIFNNLNIANYDQVVITVTSMVGNPDCPQELSQSFTVSQEPIPNFVISECSSDNSGMLSLSVGVDNFHSCLGAPFEAYTLVGSNGEVEINLTNPGSLPFVMDLDGDGSTYNFTLTDICTGCSTDFSVELPVCVICNPNAGVMPTPTQVICDGGSASAQSTGYYLEPGMMLIYGFHTLQGNQIGNVLATNTTGVFYLSDVPLADYNITYYISPIVGYPIGGGIDLEDPCTVWAQGTPVVYLAPLTVQATEICDWEFTGDLNVVFTTSGGYPAYNNSSLYQYSGLANLSASAGQVINVSLGQMDGLTYTINVIDELGCSISYTSDPVICYKTPVDWKGFTLEAIVNGNALVWNVGSETDNNYFSVEWSRDGNNFIDVQQVHSLGNTNSDRQYAYLHKNTTNGEHYYRIKQVDYNGQYSYSEIKSIYRGSAENDIEVFPIPTSDELQIVLPVNSPSQVSYNIYDIAGKLVMSGELDLQNAKINIANIVAGNYILSVKADTQSWQKRIVKY